jgi:hypothetical protein
MHSIKEKIMHLMYMFYHDCKCESGFRSPQYIVQLILERNSQLSVDCCITFLCTETFVLLVLVLISFLV